MNNLQAIFNLIYDYHKQFKELPEITDQQITFTKKFRGLTYFTLPEEAIEKIRKHVKEKYS